MHFPSRRQSYSQEGHFDRHAIGRHFDGPYLYNENGHGMAILYEIIMPFGDYMEPRRFRSCLDYTDPLAFHGGRDLSQISQHRDTPSLSNKSNYGGGSPWREAPIGVTGQEGQKARGKGESSKGFPCGLRRTPTRANENHSRWVRQCWQRV
ncbi:hypothetical protein I3760_04G146300 [Carya illinoinensis]|nr:hypothetical protein I3760_04G146300 [Carya illinoinensis]